MPRRARARSIRRAALLAAALLPCAHAARPLITDDARIVDARSCQLESWLRRNHDSTEYWALPGCNVGGNLELTLGGARTHDTQGTRSTDLVLQGKTLLRTLQPNGWGWGVAAGLDHHPDDGTRDLYAYVPLSWSLRDDRLFVHANVGARRDGRARRNEPTWGLAFEAPLGARSALIGEAFSQERGRSFGQAGARWWLVPERVQIDATVGSQWGGGSASRWMSIGLRLLSPPFLP